MLKQRPELYWWILAEAANIAQGKEQQTQETVKKLEAQQWLKEFGGEQGEKAKWRREKLNLSPIPEPEIDAVTGEILNALTP